MPRKPSFPSPARNQGRRPPRIDGPSPGTAIWLKLGAPPMASGCVADIKCQNIVVGTPNRGPSMRGLGFAPRHPSRHLLRGKRACRAMGDLADTGCSAAGSCCVADIKCQNIVVGTPHPGASMLSLGCSAVLVDRALARGRV